MSADFIDGNKALLLRRDLLRSYLLEVLGSPASLPPDALSAGLEIYALPSDPKTLAAALDYLRQKGLVELSHSRISSAHVRAKLTAEGRDYLESGGF